MSLDQALLLASTVSKKSPDEVTPGATVQLVAANVSEAEGASGLHWDDAARSVTFSYPGRGGKRTVWISNAFSAAFRLELARRYELGGIVVDDVSVEGGGADVWSPIQQVSDTGELTLSRPNGELFAPVWSSAEGTISPAVGDAVTWVAPPAPGTYTVTLIVSDGVVRAGQQVSLDVTQSSAGGP
jgi:hypothetical protein